MGRDFVKVTIAFKSNRKDLELGNVLFITYDNDEVVYLNTQSFNPHTADMKLRKPKSIAYNNGVCYLNIEDVSYINVDMNKST